MDKPERTLIIIKPDAVQRHLIGEIITRFEKKGFRLIASKFTQISKETAKKHYDVHKDKPFYDTVVEYLSSSPSMIMVWESAGIVKMARKMIGRTFGYEASAGTIRGDFGSSRGFNLIHASDAKATAAYEIPLFFKSKELTSYEFADNHWIQGTEE